jgi:fermentation-respiration switch protein FrsA (DUF1100 family)
VRVGKLVAGVALACVVLNSAAWAGSTSATVTKVDQETHAVGVLTETLVDTHRSTPAWDGQPILPQRTLVTTIWYPANGPLSSSQPKTGAAPDRSGGPFPLIVFSHGLGADPQEYGALLSYWAASGFVVAAPQFPLTSAHTPGGPDEGDVTNQPADVRFVVTSVLKESASAGGTLSGLVNPREIGAAGHSNGAITTLALAADTCCQDPRIKAAEILAGDELSFPGGHYDFGKAPPLLLVHGTADEFIPYPQAINIFNDARGPKALLTIKGGSHEAAAGFSTRSAASVLHTTTDFFSAYLTGNQEALSRLSSDGQKGVTTMRFDRQAGSRDTITTVPPPILHLHASATPTTHLANNQVVTVHWSGYTAGKVVNVLECAASDVKSNSSSACSFAHAHVLTPDPTGTGSLKVEMVEGPVGTGTCDASHPGCLIIVNNASSSAPTSSVRIPISFGP